MIEITYNYRYSDEDHPAWVENGGAEQGRDQFLKWDLKMLRWYPSKGGRIGDIMHRFLSRLNIVDFVQVMNVQDGDVINFWPRVKVLTTNMSKIVPEGLPNRMKSVVIDNTNQDNPITELQPKTWHEWANLNTESYKATIIDDHTYFGAHFCAKNGGEALTGTELNIIQNNADTSLLTVDEFQALQPDTTL